jgi:hypothetical protein
MNDKYQRRVLNTNNNTIKMNNFLSNIIAKWVVCANDGKWIVIYNEYNTCHFLDQDLNVNGIVPRMHYDAHTPTQDLPFLLALEWSYDRNFIDNILTKHYKCYDDAGLSIDNIHDKTKKFQLIRECKEFIIKTINVPKPKFLVILTKTPSLQPIKFFNMDELFDSKIEQPWFNSHICHETQDIIVLKETSDANNVFLIYL